MDVAYKNNNYHFMGRPNLQYLTTLLLLLCTSLAFSLEPVNVGALVKETSLSGHVEYQIDQLGQYQVDNILTDSHWLAPRKETLSFGYSSSVYWLRFQLTNQSAEDASRLLEIAYPVLDDLQIYIYDDSNLLAEKYHLGDKLPFAQREVDHRNFLVPVEIDANRSQTWIMRIETSSAVQIPMSVWPERDFFIEDQSTLIGMGVYYGIMLIMVLYNLVVYFSVRERSYLYYVFYVASMAIFLASLQGLSFQYVWPLATSWNDSAIIVMLSGVVFFGGLFARVFLGLEEGHKYLYNVFGFMVLVSACIFVAVHFAPYYVLIKTLIVLAFAVICLVTYTGILRWVQGYSAARLFTIAWSSILLGGAILAFNKFNIIPRNNFTENAVQIGSAIEVILLSFALADRLNQEKTDRFDAQVQALAHEKTARLAQAEALSHERQAREAQERVLEVKQKANQTLEEKVKERTSELELANKKLAELSTTDGLTGVRNRRCFDKVLEREYNRARREKEYLSILMLDIDHFKQVNDTYGHQAGDEALKVVAGILKEVIHRTTDVIARYGGEEFAVVLTNTEVAGAYLVAEKIRKSVAKQKIETENTEFSLTMSIGVMGDQPNDNNSPDDWVKKADAALYTAKEEGRNKVVLAPSCSGSEGNNIA